MSVIDFKMEYLAAILNLWSKHFSFFFIYKSLSYLLQSFKSFGRSVQEKKLKQNQDSDQLWFPIAMT